MKKCINYAFVYAIAAMAGGVFYREFTKWNDFTSVTVLGKVHGHLFALGTALFLIVALFAAHHDLASRKTFRWFVGLHNIGLPLATMMMLVRGICQVLNVPLSSGASAAISGMAGIGHMMIGTGLILLLVSLKKVAQN